MPACQSRSSIAAQYGPGRPVRGCSICSITTGWTSNWVPSLGPAFATTFTAAHPTASTIILWSRFKILCLQLPVPQHGHESYIITFFELTFVFLMKEDLGQAHRDLECMFFDDFNEDDNTKPIYLISMCLVINWV